jgi:hypothetical protein
LAIRFFYRYFCGQSPSACSTYKTFPRQRYSNPSFPEYP